MQVYAAFEHESFKLEAGMKPDYGVKSIALESCRNSWAACSLVLACPESAMLLLENRTAFTPKGPWPVVRVSADLEGLDCVLYEAGMFDCEDDVKRADILLDNGFSYLRPWLPVQMYMKVNVPGSVKAGQYRGCVSIYAHRLFEDEQLLEKLDFTIDVADVALPREKKFYLNLWQHLSNIARKHETRLFSDDHFAILEHYVRTLGELGNKVATVIASDIPWSGQGCFLDAEYKSDLFEYNYVKVWRNTDGSYEYDYSVVERYINLCDQYGTAEEIGIFGLIRVWQNPEHGYGALAPDYPDGIRISYTDRADGAIKFMRTAAEIKGYIAALHDWLDRKGWLERAVIIADEPPDMAEFSRSLAALREAGPRFRLQMDVPPKMLMEELREVIDNYTPGIDDFAGRPELATSCREWVAGKVQFSVCCWPALPNNFLRSPLLESRLMGPLAAFLGVDGFLRWNYTVWPENPRECMVFRPGSWESGDTCFVYPSRGGLPLYSLRYFALKRGIEDFELIRAVQEKCADAPALLRQYFGMILRNTDFSQWKFDYGTDRESMYSLTPAEYDRARALLVEALTRAR